MNFADQLRVLLAAQGHPAKLALATVDLNYPALCDTDRAALKQALEAAAIPHWCDESILAALLEISSEESAVRLGQLRGLNVVEPFVARGRTAVNVSEIARVALRTALVDDSLDRFRALTGRAARHFEGDHTPHGRIEWIYHLLCSEQDRGAAGLATLYHEWRSCAPAEDRFSLDAALKEFEASGLAQGRARVWILLLTSSTRFDKGESAQLLDTVQGIVRLAKVRPDSKAEAYAQCQLGDVLEAQGKLTEAQAAYGEYLAITRRLVAEYLVDGHWQRELVRAHSRVGDVLEAQGRLGEAEGQFRSALEMGQRLVSADTTDIGCLSAVAATNSRL